MKKMFRPLLAVILVIAMILPCFPLISSAATKINYNEETFQWLPRHTFDVDGKTYYQLTVMDGGYKGLKRGAIIFVDENYYLVTDGNVIKKLAYTSSVEGNITVGRNLNEIAKFSDEVVSRSYVIDTLGNDLVRSTFGNTVTSNFKGIYSAMTGNAVSWFKSYADYISSTTTNMTTYMCYLVMLYELMNSCSDSMTRLYKFNQSDAFNNIDSRGLSYADALEYDRIVRTNMADLRATDYYLKYLASKASTTKPNDSVDALDILDEVVKNVGSDVFYTGVGLGFTDDIADAISYCRTYNELFSAAKTEFAVLDKWDSYYNSFNILDPSMATYVDASTVMSNVKTLTGTTPSASTTPTTSAYTPGTYKPSDEIGLNIRSGASTSYSKVGTIMYGTSFVVTEISGSWGKTTCGGTTGWVCLDYATKVSTNTSTGTTSSTRFDGTWLFPVDQKYYNSFSDWCCCPGYDKCVICNEYHTNWGDSAHSGQKGHNGIDLAVPTGTPVYASASGTYYTGGSTSDARGYYVVIEHNLGNGTSYYSGYQHLSKFNSSLKSGQTVKAGDIIGYSGSSGVGAGVHLHFGIVIGKSGKGLSGLETYELWSSSNPWVTSTSQTEGRIINNPADNFPTSAQCTLEAIKVHKGSVRYTFNKSEVNIGGSTGSSQPTPTYYVDVNGYVDGEYKTSLNGFVTFDVYINGSLVKSGVGDFCTAYADGTKYEIKNIKAASGYTYASGSNLTGTISGGHAYPSITLTTTIKEPSDTSSLPDGWRESIPSGESSKNYKSAVFYRYRDTTYGGWSASQTTSTAPTASDVLQIVSTTKYYNYYHYCCQYYDGRYNVDSIKYGTGSVYHTLKTTTKLTSSSVEDKGGKTLYGGESKWACSKNFHVWAQASPFETSEYSYQTRTKSISNWSAWSQTKPSSASGREIESITLYNYQPLTYTVSYNANGGSGAPASQTKTDSKTITLSSTVPTRSGYTFKGWATSASGSVAYQPGSSYTANAAVTLYAVWQKNPEKYSVKFNANGGSSAPASQTKTENVALTLSSTVPTRSGYTFKGWATSASGSVAYQPGASFTTNANTTLYAVWQKNPEKYSVKFDANGGSGAPANQTKTENVALTLSTTVPTRSGYTFKGWATSASGSVAYQPGSSYTANAAVTLYAVWQKNPEKYSVKFDANGGSGAPASQTKTENVALTLSNTVPTRSGYTFKGWATSASGSVAYQPGASYTANAAVTLYAVWQKNISYYTVKFNANGGSGAPASQTKTENVALTLSTTVPTRSGYTFKGWATSASGSVAYQPGASYTANAAVTLYAVWQKNISYYTVKFNANGGSGAPASQTKTENVALTLSNTVPTRSGYTFKGWATSASGSVAYQPGSSYTANAAVTLYAVWQKNISYYTVKFNANGGSGAPANQTKTENVALTLSNTVPTRSGYTFKGWATSASGSVAYQPGASFTTNANTTLYAVWQQNAPIVGGSIIIDSKTCAPGSTVKINVSIKDNPGINTLVFAVKYDSNALELSSVERGTVFDQMSYTKKIFLDSKEFENVYTNGVLCTLTFKVKDSASSGSYAISLGSVEAIDCDINDHDLAVSSGSITVVKKFTVKFDANGGSGAPASQTKTDSKTLTLSTTVPTRSGYTFKGWATSASGSVAYQPGASFTTNANTTLYAVWQKNTVPSAGKLVIDSKTCTAGSTVKIDVKVEGNTGFAFLSLTAKYDKNALELVNVEKGTLISDMTASKNIVFVADDNVKGNGLLLSLTFKVKENADSGDYTIGLSVNELYDQDANDKSFTVSGGKLTVMSFVYGDANGDGKVDGKDIVLLKKYIANYDYDTGKSTVSISAGADANGDGKVDGKDIVLLKKYIANYDYDTGKSSVVLGPTK